MEKVLTKEESYVERRKLFKNIWETAMHIDEKEADVSKPKIIKTVRLDDNNRMNIGKTKKHRIKNLRNVCNRLLDFCDRPDAEDVMYQKLASKSNVYSPLKSNGPKPKKFIRQKRKIRKAKSFSPTVKDPRVVPTAPNSLSPNQVKRTTIVKMARQGGKHLLNPQTSLVGEPGAVTSKRKVKKKPSIRKIIQGHNAKSSLGWAQPGFVRNLLIVPKININ